MRNFPAVAPAREAFHDFPLADADQCVKCALCLPHCPTYKLSQHEGDSPRGRIALMQGLAQGVIDPVGSALPHLDGCLVCRACEPVCPAKVPYGRLIDAGRAGLWRTGHRPGRLWRLLALLRRTPRRIRWLNGLLRFLHASGLARLVAGLPLGRVARLSMYMRTTGKPLRAGTFNAPRAGGEVALFLGCIARSADASAQRAAIRVLNAMQYTVHVPASQTCCGAMDAHAGDRGAAIALARVNVAAFADMPVLSTASGCGVQLQDYRELHDSVADAAPFAMRVHDVMHFIAAHADALPPLSPLPARAVVHAPCTLRNGMREALARDVLGQIPELVVEPLRHQDCCGAAGSYLFEHAGNADALGERLLDALGDDIPEFFVTSNTGCALHLRRLAKRRGLKMRVVHPVELLAEAVRGTAR